MSTPRVVHDNRKPKYKAIWTTHLLNHHGNWDALHTTINLMNTAMPINSSVLLDNDIAVVFHSANEAMVYKVRFE